jgi:hypothetical protein
VRSSVFVDVSSSLHRDGLVDVEVVDVVFLVRLRFGVFVHEAVVAVLAPLFESVKV